MPLKPGYRVTATRFRPESLIISIACGPRLPRDSRQGLPDFAPIAKQSRLDPRRGSRVTASALDPRIASLLPVIPMACAARVPRDIRRSRLGEPGSGVGAGSRRPVPHRGRHDAGRGPASAHASLRTPRRRPAVSPPQTARPRTTSGTRYIDAPSPKGAPSSSRWITIPPRRRADHSATWTTIPPRSGSDLGRR